jgi:hypothetical protein
MFSKVRRKPSMNASTFILNALFSSSTRRNTRIVAIVVETAHILPIKILYLKFIIPSSLKTINNKILL